MITIKRLITPELIDEAGILLYQSYIEQRKWEFSPDNPSKLRIEVRNHQKLLVDRFTKTAIWFGAFDNDQLVGCARLHSIDDNNQLEIEGYPSSQPIHEYILQGEKSSYFELTKVATRQDYVGKGIVKRLFLAIFTYCEHAHYSVIACTHNGYLKAFFKKIELPLKKESAFKYEP